MITRTEWYNPGEWYAGIRDLEKKGWSVRQIVNLGTDPSSEIGFIVVFEAER